ncbi:hypothetical protein BX589_101128 [Paraburkholderia fungorum]|uniref:hypothetical protein n=1 Tax=Paraburkholderia fungorum TaxID=134537 RepID=UPI000D0566E2|nr:hypothetical protein [Paraburkholderia fungorum]PRZ56478.1 hypothetical protein BX589_101128 [Paraburkholderia fungorum]
MSSPNHALNQVVVSFIRKDNGRPMNFVFTDADEWSMTTTGAALAQLPSGNYGPAMGAMRPTPSANLGIILSKSGEAGSITFTHKDDEVGGAALSVMTHCCFDFLGGLGVFLEHLQEYLDVAEPNSFTFKFNGVDWVRDLGINLDPRSFICAALAFLPATPFHHSRGKSDLEWALMKPSERLGRSRR